MIEEGDKRHGPIPEPSTDFISQLTGSRILGPWALKISQTDHVGNCIPKPII